MTTVVTSYRAKVKQVQIEQVVSTIDDNGVTAPPVVRAIATFFDSTAAYAYLATLNTTTVET